MTYRNTALNFSKLGTDVRRQLSAETKHPLCLQICVRKTYNTILQNILLAHPMTIPFTKTQIQLFLNYLTMGGHSVHIWFMFLTITQTCWNYFLSNVPNYEWGLCH